MPRILTLSFTVFFLFGCATGYQAKDLKYGFYESQLDDNSYKVSYVGNGSTTANEASDYILLRNAELTLIDGYKYFMILDRQDSSKISTFKTPPIANSNVNRNVGSSGKARIYELFKPSGNNTITFTNEQKEGRLVYDAKFVFDSISAKYGIARAPTR